MIPDGLISSIAGWLPPYSEQWATTYLQVLFESFLFALGVPTALYSLIVDKDIKHVAQTRVKAGRYVKVTVLLYVAAFIIVWFLHPDPPNIAPQNHLAATRPAEVPRPTTPIAPAPNPSRVAVSEDPIARSTASTTAPENLGPLATPAAASPQATTGQAASIPEVRDVSTEQAPQAVVTPSLTSLLKSVFAALTVTVLPFVVLVTGINLNKRLGREKVVAHLAAELLKSLMPKSPLDTDELRERVTKKELCAEDLSYLGEHGRAGSEKKMVLDVINNLVEKVQEKEKARTLTYNGHELESLIRHIPAMLDNKNRPGNAENYLRAGEVLSNIWRWLGPRKVTGDGVATRGAIEHLALQSVDSMTEDTATAYLGIAAECDSQMVFDIGLAAIKAEKHSLAAGALSKLEAMAGADHPDENASRETMANLLGMVAQLAADGPSGSRRAEKTLLLNEELFTPSLRDALTDASDYQFRAGRFRTADRVGQLLAQVGAMKTLDLDQPVAPRV